MSKKIDRTGESITNKQGLKMTIIAYRNRKDLDVKFDDNTIITNREYKEFQNGSIFNPNHLKNERIGETNISKNGQLMTIIAYRGSMDIDIQFDDDTIVKNKSYYQFKHGGIENPNFYKSRIGEKYRDKNGQMVEIIEYRNSHDIDVKFDDDTIIYHKYYKEFADRTLFNPNYLKSKREGELAISLGGELIELTQYKNANDVNIKFEDGTPLKGVSYRQFKTGVIKNPSNPDLSIQKYRQSFVGKENTATNGQRMKITAYHDAKHVDIEFEDGTIVKDKSISNFNMGRIQNPNYPTFTGTSYNELVCQYYFSKFGFQKAEKGSLKDVGLGNMELDLYADNINGYKIAIEYDGYNHTIEKDERKNMLCNKAGIILIRIREPHLPILTDKNSIDFVLNTNKHYSQNLINTISNIIDYINIKCDTSFEFYVNKTLDKQCIEALLQLKHDRYRSSRIGEIKESKDGLLMEIVSYRNCHDIDVLFEDNYLAKHKKYSNFIKGNISHDLNCKIEDNTLFLDEREIM